MVTVYENTHVGDLRRCRDDARRGARFRILWAAVSRYLYG
jgi:hypothetical protein